jgi:uncharacterized protein (TIRG00374 family)
MSYERLLVFFIKLSKFLPSRLKLFASNSGIKKDNLKVYLIEIKKLFTNKRFILKYLIMTSFIILASPLIIYFITLAYYFPLSYSTTFSIYWIAFILGRLSWLPGGLGVRDVTLGSFLHNLGISPSLSIKLIFIYRLVSLTPYFIIGSFVLIYYNGIKFKDFLLRKSS